MRVNERQQKLNEPKEWLKICEYNIEKFIVDNLSDSVRYVSANINGIQHGEWLIHSIHIAKDLKSAWACISDNLEYLEIKRAKELAFEIRLANKYVLKPLLDWVTLHASTLLSLASENKNLDNDQLEYALKINNIKIPLRTHGYIKNSLAWIKKLDNGNISMSYSSNCVSKKAIELYEILLLTIAQKVNV